ncbi:hypothetical protein FACS1894116_07610 [Betaproteobacteria bacterium]|nr:hypothetical protein AGMMS49543_07240 [Betaproteobacteria bacterium]GHT94112.1 hypothetical protein FACS1894116_07610 [Betaproteobacteria bacterium]GHU03176.1 hypothetical protein AGMMS49960_17100 [Betaproteobacteria bacterium]GHU12834.1 hypothetical protein AGMMS50225_21600 [Betaproteobacteria bacterium]GHU19763.1 hypothetical protein AGMMS50243_12580 [Betaproteobacteria bacterium]
MLKLSRLLHFLLRSPLSLLRVLFFRLTWTRRTAFSAASAWGLTLALLSTLWAGNVAAQDTPAADNDESSDLASMAIWGIINYTRWPQENDALKVCLLGESVHAEFIRRSAKVIQLRRAVVLQDIPATVDKIRACDVAYFGVMSAQQRTPLLRALTGLAVLTIGEGVDFCSAGGMFCLLPERNDAGEGANEGLFATNLDVISRSTLKITPRVLRLSRQMRGQGN